MINYERQREVIQVMAREISNHLDLDEYQGIMNFVGDWTLSDLAESYVGPTGKLVFSINEKENTSLVRNLLAMSSREIDRLNRAMDDFHRNLHWQACTSECLPEWLYSRSTVVSTTNKIIVEHSNPRMKNVASVSKSFRGEAARFKAMVRDSRLEDSVKEELNLIVENLLSRVIQSIDEAQQAVSKNIEIKTGTLTISALPEDILTASAGTKFGSCFSPDGEYSLSPVGYLQNRDVLIAQYTPDGDTFQLGGLTFEDKSWRIFVFIHESGFALSTEYPTQSPILETVVKELLKVKSNFDKEHRWDEGESFDTSAFDYYSTFYQDSFSRAYVDSSVGCIYIDNSEVSPYDGAPLEDGENTLESQYSINHRTCESCWNVASSEDDLFRCVHEEGDEMRICENCLDNSTAVPDEDGLYWSSDREEYFLSSGTSYICRYPDNHPELVNAYEVKLNDEIVYCESEEDKEVALSLLKNSIIY